MNIIFIHMNELINDLHTEYSSQMVNHGFPADNQIGIKEIQADAAHVHEPDAGIQQTAGQADGDGAPLPLLVAYGLDGQFRETLLRV